MPPHYQPGLHRFAVITALVALLPITVGALVTTMQAGMAFLDWPSSDGHNMFLYPWLLSLRDDPKKFVEHGHRLAGIVIGIVSIALAITFWLRESRSWARWLGIVVLILVCSQGYLGGLRVKQADVGLALLHGLLASWVFAFISAVALMTSKGWHEASEFKVEEWNLSTGISAVLAVVTIQLQYVLGGLLRHHGKALGEHVIMAFVVLFVVMWLFVAAYGSGIGWLRSNATWLAFAVVLQISLGLLTYVAKFGTGIGDNVAVHNSSLQLWSQTAHTVLGMFVWMLAVMYLLRVFRIMWFRYGTASAINSPTLDHPTSGGLPISTSPVQAGGRS